MTLRYLEVMVIRNGKVELAMAGGSRGVATMCLFVHVEKASGGSADVDAGRASEGFTFRGKLLRASYAV